MQSKNRAQPVAAWLITIHYTFHNLFLDWPKTYSVFSKSTSLTSSSCRSYTIQRFTCTLASHWPIIRHVVNNVITSAMGTRKPYNPCQTRETASKLSLAPSWQGYICTWLDEKVCFLRICTNVNKKIKVANKTALSFLSRFFSETSEEEEDENKAMLR